MTIDNQADVIDVRDVIARVEELRERNVPRIIAGWNMPGYMPDSVPVEFDGFAAARKYIAGELFDRCEVDSEISEDDEKREDVRQRAQAIEFGVGSLGITVYGWHYWITKGADTGLDADELDELQRLESLLSELAGNGGDEKWEGAVVSGHVDP
ncbi:hypothetical protein KTD26_20545 [Burkholderia multivorans]|uniref:hypothetical protein n=1 Tax=Burkholderia multivorans TaxID=87883 RepID=UPI001C24BF40|nr:hypothetical protein [Burkholderia multivorans]MBU9144911.1 hypothetical protein [Burkholderia multivorans]MBU9537162.1 hypothetical protein [Burkholderia multivorans]